jgi:uncharacterized coiled-coil protein SlyX
MTKPESDLLNRVYENIGEIHEKLNGIQTQVAVVATRLDNLECTITNTGDAINNLNNNGCVHHRTVELKQRILEKNLEKLESQLNEKTAHIPSKKQIITIGGLAGTIIGSIIAAVLQIFK